MQWSSLWGEIAADFPTANQGRAQLAAIAAYHEFMHFRQWSFREITIASIALSAGVAKYTLIGTSPVLTDFDGLIDVGLEMNTGGEVRPMLEAQQSDFDRWFGHQKTSGDPAVYCVRGGAPAASAAAMLQGGQQQLQLTPPPIATADHGQALQIAYFRSVATAEPNANTDIPLIPAQYHYALIVGGKAYLAESIGNMQRAQMFRSMFQQRMTEAASNDSGLRMRDRQLLTVQSGASVYPITGQSPETFNQAVRPYDLRST